ncbi:hypothetical protein J3458_019383 [Metarhizium acridum]|uniref:uncharacterized protein n=1 Tax=Metarhizium acridum TaxID=92637 RepID=UPI001C6BB688|nr:hypothetical protein J3458_019383 [Metarhizium acridum]
MPGPFCSTKRHCKAVKRQVGRKDLKGGTGETMTGTSQMGYDSIVMARGLGICMLPCQHRHVQLPCHVPQFQTTSGAESQQSQSCMALQDSSAARPGLLPWTSLGSNHNDGHDPTTWPNSDPGSTIPIVRPECVSLVLGTPARAYIQGKEAASTPIMASLFFCWDNMFLIVAEPTRSGSVPSATMRLGSNKRRHFASWEGAKGQSEPCNTIPYTLTT